MFLIKKAFLNTFLIKIIFIIGIAWTHLSISAVLAKITTVSRASLYRAPNDPSVAFIQYFSPNI
jgi:hypothetical protein